MAIDLERAQELEHVLNFGDLGFLVNRGVRCDLVSTDFGHLHGQNAFGEHSFAFHDQIVGEFQTINVDIPIHPLGWTDDRFCARRAVSFADHVSFLGGDQFPFEQLLQFWLQGGCIDGSEIFPHLLAHEHPVSADVNDTALSEQAVDELFDFWVNQGFATANGDHRRITFDGCLETLIQGHHVLERGGIFPDASAAGASQVTCVQRLELQDHRKLGGLAEFVFDDVAGNLFGQRKRESHMV